MTFDEWWKSNAKLEHRSGDREFSRAAYEAGRSAGIEECARIAEERDESGYTLYADGDAIAETLRSLLKTEAGR